MQQQFNSSQLSIFNRFIGLTIFHNNKPSQMTSASSHLSKNLKELIKSIGETKSKQEEDRIILAQLASLKPKLSEKNLTPKQIKQHLISALYIEMLGHSAPFAHIHAINLTQNKNLILKRIGYLMCSLFFDSNSDLLIMLVATIIKDLTNGDVHEIVICLTSLGQVLNATIAAAVTEHVVKLLTHTTDLVRKKAILILQKIKIVTGTEVPQYKEKMKKAFCDRQPSVMAAALGLYLQQVKQNPRKYRELAGSFVIILKQVVEHKLPKEFDYHRMPAPWIQMRILKILQLLGRGDQKASEHCYTILEQVLRRAEEANNNISIAITYQCVRTIASIYPNDSLQREAAGVLSKLLESHSTNNMKYLGIQALGLLYKNNSKLLDEYQLIIVECLQSKDQTLQRETLDLLFRMTTQDNVEIIVSKMLNSLHCSTDNYFRSNLVIKITQLAQRFSTTHKWYLATMQILFELGSQYLSEDILNNFLKLVIENYHSHENFGEEIVIKMVELIEKVVPTDFVLKAASWVIGQVGSDYYKDNAQKLEDLSKIILKCLENDYQHQSSKKWVIDAMVKLSSAPAFQNHDDTKLVLEKFSRNGDIQLYQRALQAKRLARYNSALKNSLEISSKFQEGLPFLNGFVQKAKQAGARQYQKMKIVQANEQQLRFTPYQVKKVTTSFQNFLNEKKQEQKKQLKTSQERQVKSPVFASFEPMRQKEKKPLITPEDKAKQNMAKKLIGAPKGPSSKPIPSLVTKPPQQKKKLEKTQNIDLI